MRLQRADQRLAARFIPKNALPITEDESLGLVYVYPLGKKYGAIAYAGTAAKRSWHYTFRKDTELDNYIAKWFEGLRNHREYVTKRREERKAPHTFKVGDIVYNSWGYGQTNIDWYRVAKTSDRFVWLVQICGSSVPDEGVGPMSGMTQPAINVDSDDPTKWGIVDADKRGVLLNKSTRHAATGSHITMRHGCCSKWDGKPKYESWYA